MLYSLFLYLISICWVIVSKFIFKNKITFKEMLLHLGGATLAIFMSLGMLKAYKSLKASESYIISGFVTDKKQNMVSCSHDYECNCTRTCDSNGDCYETCDICYEHSYDYDWDVYTTIGGITISRVDRQGTTEPQRWTDVIIGEEVAKARYYQDYIKASENSLFKNVNINNHPVPNYPRIYDYYRINRIIGDSGKYNYLNDDLNKMLATNFPNKRASVNLIVEYGETDLHKSLESTWKGGKLNDINIVVYLDDDENILSTYVFTFARNDGNHNFAVVLRDELNNLKKLDNNFLNVVEKNLLLLYTFPNAEKYAYLKDNISIPWGVYLIISILILCINVAITIVIKNNGVNTNDKQRKYKRYTRF